MSDRPFREIDNREPHEVIAYLEAENEALKLRIEQLEEDNAELRGFTQDEAM